MPRDWLCPKSWPWAAKDTDNMSIASEATTLVIHGSWRRRVNTRRGRKTSRRRRSNRCRRAFRRRSRNRRRCRPSNKELVVVVGVLLHDSRRGNARSHACCHSRGRRHRQSCRGRDSGRRCRRRIRVGTGTEDTKPWQTNTCLRNPMRPRIKTSC